MGRTIQLGQPTALRSQVSHNAEPAEWETRPDDRATEPAQSQVSGGPSDSVPALLRPEDLAKIFQVKIETIFRWVACGKLPEPIRFNRKLVRFRAADIAAAIEAMGNPINEKRPGPNVTRTD